MPAIPPRPGSGNPPRIPGTPPAVPSPSPSGISEHSPPAGAVNPPKVLSSPQNQNVPSPTSGGKPSVGRKSPLTPNDAVRAMLARAAHPESAKLVATLRRFPTASSVLDFLRRHPRCFNLRVQFEGESELELAVAETVVRLLERFRKKRDDFVWEALREDMRAYLLGKRDFLESNPEASSLNAVRRYTVLTGVICQVMPDVAEEKSLREIKKSTPTRKLLLDWVRRAPQCIDWILDAAFELGVDISSDPLVETLCLLEDRPVSAIAPSTDILTDEAPRVSEGFAHFEGRPLSSEEQAVYDWLGDLRGDYAVLDFARRHPRLCDLADQLQASEDVRRCASALFVERFPKSELDALLRDLVDYRGGRRSFLRSDWGDEDESMGQLVAYTFLTNLFDAFYRTPQGQYRLEGDEQSAAEMILEMILEKPREGESCAVSERDLCELAMELLEAKIGPEIFERWLRDFPNKQFVILTAAKACGVSLGWFST